MPYYEYVCVDGVLKDTTAPVSGSCIGFKQEVQKSIYDDGPVLCPYCKGVMKKLMSHTEFRMHSIKEK